MRHSLIKFVLTDHQINSSLSAQVRKLICPSKPPELFPLSIPHLYYGGEYACSGFCYSKFLFPDQGKPENTAWGQQFWWAQALSGCCSPQASDTCSGLTQNHKKHLCFWLVLSSCHLLPSQDSLQTTACTNSKPLRRTCPWGSLNTHSGTLCKATLKGLTQWILDVHNLLEDTHFPDAMTLTGNIRAFQDVIQKVRYIPSQFCSKPFLQPKRTPVNTSPNHWFWGRCILQSPWPKGFILASIVPL